MHSLGPGQGIENKRKTRPEGPNKIENKFNINQKLVPAEPDLFVEYFEHMFYSIWTLRHIFLLLFIPWPGPELSMAGP